MSASASAQSRGNSQSAEDTLDLLIRNGSDGFPVGSSPNLRKKDMVIIVILNQLGYLWLFVMHKTRQAVLAGAFEDGEIGEVISGHQEDHDALFLVFNIMLFLAEIMFLTNFSEPSLRKHIGSRATVLLLVHSAATVYRGISEGHDYFFFFCVFGWEIMEATDKGGFSRFQRIMLSSVFLFMSLSAVTNDVDSAVFCAKYTPLSGLRDRGRMSPFLSSCIPKASRAVCFPLVFSSYLLYLSGKFEVTVNSTLSAYLIRWDMLKFLYDKKISTKTRLDTPEGLQLPDSEEQTNQVTHKPSSPLAYKGIGEKTVLDSAPFEVYSSSGYTPEEARALEEIMKLLRTESELENTDAPETGVYEYLCSGNNRKQGSLKGVATGLVHASPAMLTSWCWDFCSKERCAFNAKSDVKREIISADSDHCMTFFQRKWFPKPHLHRDFLCRQVWKRLDDHTVLVITYDDVTSLYNESLFSQQSKKDEKTVRGSMKSILILQELLPEDSSTSETTTKVSHLCVLDLSGELGGSLNLNNLKSAMSTIYEMQDFFSPSDARNDWRSRSESVDDADFKEFEGFGGTSASAKLDGFQILLKDAENMLDQVTNEDTEGKEKGDGMQDEFPDQTYKYGAFVMWMLKNHPEELFQTGTTTLEEGLGSDLGEKSMGSQLAPTRWRLLEFKDSAMEAEYFDYQFLSNQKALMTLLNVGLCHCAVFAVVLLALFLVLDSSRPVLLVFLVLDLIFFALKAKTRANINKDDSNQQIMLLFSAMILINDLISVSILTRSQVWFMTDARNEIAPSEKTDLCILWFTTFESVWFYMCIVHFEAKVGMGHAVFHWVEVFTRVGYIFNKVNYRAVLYLFFGPICMLALVTSSIHERDQVLRQTFFVLWSNLHEKFTYRLDSLHSVLKSAMKLPQQQREEIQIAVMSRSSISGSLGKTVTVSELEYEKKVGQGSQSNVYLARYRNKIVAVKQIKPENLNQRSVASMLDEIKILSGLSHNNILQLYASIIPTLTTKIQVVGMVTEYAKEGSLSTFLKKHDSLDWEGHKRSIALGISKGMRYLHSLKKPIIHRDLKSANCLVTEWWQVKVADFGFSCVCDESAVMSSVVGSKYYISPEMLSGDNYDCKTDVYSFGSLLADIGMGGNLQKLFLKRDDGPRGMDLNKFLTEGWRPELPVAWVEEMPVITDLIYRCWEKDPGTRPEFSEILRILSKWSGKLQRAMRESAVLRASTEYTAEDMRFVSEGMVEFNKLNQPPKRLPDVDRRNRRWFSSSLPDQTLSVHIEVALEFPSWEVIDAIIEWSSPDKTALMRELGETSCQVLHLENEHSKIVESTMIQQQKEKLWVARLLWKEIKKDNFFCWIASVDDPEKWVDMGTAGTKEIMKKSSGYNIIGSPDGNSCHLVYNTVLKDVQQLFTPRSHIAKFQKKATMEVKVIEKVLTNRKAKKAIEMQKLYDKQVRYQMSVVVDDNIEELQEHLSNSPRMADNAHGTNNETPWISKTAMDQEYREWRRGNRVVTGLDADQRRLANSDMSRKKKRNIMSGISEGNDHSEGASDDEFF